CEWGCVMHGNVIDAGSAATTTTFGGESDGTSPLAGESDNPHEWLYNAARKELGPDAGLQLSIITGYPESSCYAYMAKDAQKRRRPPGHFERAVIHSREGAPFFIAYMRNCDAPWWRDFVRAADLGRKVLELTKQGA